MNTTTKSNTYKLSLWQWAGKDTTGLTRTEKAIIDNKVAGYLHSVLNRKNY